MKNIKKYLPITFPVLYVGLKKNWLTTKEVVKFINDNLEKFNNDEKTIIDINLNEDERIAILEILRTKTEMKESIGLLAWQLAHLIAIEQSHISIHEKLKEIELLWPSFEYPESWKGFIYYMPNNNVSSEEGLYKNFLEFIENEKMNLSLSNE